MGNILMTTLKLFTLCVILNVLRYYVFGYLEQAVIMGHLFAAMEQSKNYFNNDFQTLDWITSYFYNFVLWFVTTIAFHVVQAHIRGHMVLRSLKVYGLMLVMFASISAIYMNHYSHPKDFYIINILDSVLIFPLVGIANGFLYPFFFRRPQSES